MNDASPSLITGIDPGLRSGGIVAVDPAAGDRILAAFSIVEKRTSAKEATAEARSLLKRQFGTLVWGDVEYTAAALRAEIWITKAAAALDEIEQQFGPIGFVACESFVDQRSRAREEKNRLVAKRWQTPHVIGRLEALLAGRGITAANGRLVYQNAGTVLHQGSTDMALIGADWKKPTRTDGVVVPGDSLICNEHTRSAAMHALALSFRLTANAHPPTRRTQS